MSYRIFAASLLGFASSIALITPAPVLAQEAIAAEGRGLDEIVVTARRREENIQAVPVAITALTGDKMEQQGIRYVTDLERKVPSLLLCCNSSSKGNVTFGWMRGVPGVLGYVADAPTPISGSALYFDLGGAQVLKGPQGVNFGLSTNGGAILFQPARPTDNFEGNVGVGLGDYGRREMQGVLNIPVVADKLAVRVGAQYSDKDGYITDLTQNKKLGDDHFYNLRASAVLKATDDIENYLFFNFHKSHGNSAPWILKAVNPAGTAARLFPQLNALLAEQEQLGRYTIRGAGGLGGTVSRYEQVNLVDTLTWDITDDITLKNIFGYNQFKQFTRSDLDGTPLPLFDTQVLPTEPGRPTAQYSEEFQVLGKALDQKLTFVVGSFNQWKHSNPVNVFAATLGNVAGTRTKTKERTNGLYAQGTYDLGQFVEGLSLSGGFRYSWDYRLNDTTRSTGAGVQTSRFIGEGKWKSPSYSMGLQYQIEPDVMVFVTNSKGYSSGGFNTTAPAQYQKFNPETLNNVEVGIKADWMIGGMQARTNVSGYYGFYDDIQVPVTQLVQTSTGSTLSVVTQNAATGHIMGIDAEATLLPVDWLELSGNVAYLKASYDDYISNGQDLSGTPFVSTPKWKYGISGTYHLPVPEDIGEVSLTADWTWSSKWIGTSRLVPKFGDIMPAYGNLNINITWNDVVGTQGLDATVFATNVTKNDKGNGQLGVYDTLGVWAWEVAEPRMWGVRLKYAFGS